MRIAVLAPADSIHTQRWCKALAARGHNLRLFTQHKNKSSFEMPNLQVIQLPLRGQMGYIFNALPLRRALMRWSPNLLHIHYASGYGLTGRLANYAPSVLSVWGSDVFAFPAISKIHRDLLCRNLRAATRVASTSRVMADEVCRLEPGIAPPVLTPFGVDCERFAPANRLGRTGITIGTVKTLAPVYGIDLLIRAFACLLRELQAQGQSAAANAKLVIAGDGPQRGELQRLVHALHLETQVRFLGAIPHDEVPRILATFDIFVAASRQESFGVAAIEAGAAGLPAIVSDAGGLPEVVEHGVTGLIVPRADVRALAEALRTLTLDSECRHRMGQAARNFVQSQYNWDSCVDRMETLYREVSGEANE